MDGALVVRCCVTYLTLGSIFSLNILLTFEMNLCTKTFVVYHMNNFTMFHILPFLVVKFCRFVTHKGGYDFCKGFSKTIPHIH